MFIGDGDYYIERRLIKTRYLFDTMYLFDRETFIGSFTVFRK